MHHTSVKGRAVVSVWSLFQKILMLRAIIILSYICNKGLGHVFRLNRSLKNTVFYQKASYNKYVYNKKTDYVVTCRATAKLHLHVLETIGHICTICGWFYSGILTFQLKFHSNFLNFISFICLFFQQAERRNLPERS